jgi:hypothetical protein
VDDANKEDPFVQGDAHVGEGAGDGNPYFRFFLVFIVTTFLHCCS